MLHWGWGTTHDECTLLTELGDAEVKIMRRLDDIDRKIDLFRGGKRHHVDHEIDDDFRRTTVRCADKEFLVVPFTKLEIPSTNGVLYG